MDTTKTGELIRALRKENALTQAELAAKLSLSDKTVSKWERGMGLPDVSVLTPLAEIFGVDVKQLLDGEITANSFVCGNLKNNVYTVCPVCGNLVVTTGSARVYCCGRKLSPLIKQKPDLLHDIKVESVENEWYLASSHPMEKEHYISFAALVTGDKLDLVKFYPEWNLNARIASHAHGILLWYCTKHGLFYKTI